MGFWSWLKRKEEPTPARDEGQPEAPSVEKSIEPVKQPKVDAGLVNFVANETRSAVGGLDLGVVYQKLSVQAGQVKDIATLSTLIDSLASTDRQAGKLTFDKLKSLTGNILEYGRTLNVRLNDIKFKKDQHRKAVNIGTVPEAIDLDRRSLAALEETEAYILKAKLSAVIMLNTLLAVYEFLQKVIAERLIGVEEVKRKLGELEAAEKRAADTAKLIVKTRREVREGEAGIMNSIAVISPDLLELVVGVVEAKTQVILGSMNIIGGVSDIGESMSMELDVLTQAVISVDAVSRHVAELSDINRLKSLDDGLLDEEPLAVEYSNAVNRAAQITNVRVKNQVESVKVDWMDQIRTIIQVSGVNPQSIEVIKRILGGDVQGEQFTAEDVAEIFDRCGAFPSIVTILSKYKNVDKEMVIKFTTKLGDNFFSRAEGCEVLKNILGSKFADEEIFRKLVSVDFLMIPEVSRELFTIIARNPARWILFDYYCDYFKKNGLKLNIETLMPALKDPALSQERWRRVWCADSRCVLARHPNADFEILSDYFKNNRDTMVALALGENPNLPPDFFRNK